MFKKELKQLDIWALALGSIIGWGCFVMPGINFLPKGGPAGSILGLTIGSIIISIISLSYGYMIRKYPLSGGEYIYTKNLFGKRHAFICGWMIILAYWSLIPLNATALSLVSRYILPILLNTETSPFMFGYLYTIAGWDVYAGEILLAWLFIIVIGFINVHGVKSFGRFQSLVALLMSLSVLIVFLGIVFQRPSLSNLSPGFINNSPIGIASGIFAVLAYAPYCFVGFDSIPQAAEEYKFSHKKTIRLMIIAILTGGLIYSAIVFVTAVAAPWQETINAGFDWATGEVVLRMLGNFGIVFLGLAMLCAVVSGINGFYMAASRLMYSMSKDDTLPKQFEGISNEGTPKNAIVFLMIISLIAPLFGREVLSWVVDMTCVGAAMGFIYTSSCAYKYAKKEKETPQAIISFIGILLSLIFFVEAFVPGMPGFLSIPSFIILGIWILMGFIMAMSVKPKQQ